MANILLSFFPQPSRSGLPIFYESFINSLAKCGNNIKYLNSINFLEHPWNGNNELKSDIDQKALIKEIKRFKPDLCFAFNNSIPQAIVEEIACPIILWHSDTFHYFNDKEEIKKNRDRYHYVCPFERDILTLKKELNVTDEKILHIIPATDIQKEDRSFDKNISFIGSMFHANSTNNKNITSILKEDRSLNLNKMALIIEAIHKDPLIDYDELLRKNNCIEIQKILSKTDFLNFASCQNRNHTLSTLSDLGLNIYGKGEYFDWLDVGSVLPSLALCHRDQEVYSLKDNQNIYNSSKISINISHSQAGDGFPWRIFDIMASNSCLVSDKRNGLIDFTEGYVDIPMYENPYEARKLCQDLLNDEARRKEIVQLSQKCIEEKGRWHHRFSEIESKLKVKLINSPNILQKILNIKTKEYNIREITPVLKKNK